MAGRGTGTVVAGLVIAAAGGIGAALLLASHGKKGPAVQACVDSGGGCTSSATFASGSDIRAAVTVPNPTVDPTSVQAFHSADGSPFGTLHPWDVSATGYTYTVDFGAVTGPASASIYFVVQFQDGSKSKTGVVNIVVNAPGQGGGTGGGPPGTCTSDADCSPCENCVGGTCGHRIPAAVQILDNPAGSQDEVVPVLGIIPICSWANLAFYGNQNVYTVKAKLVDASGLPVPCINMQARFQSSELQITNVTSTDANGEFEVSYWLPKPYQGPIGCPILGLTDNGTIVATLDFLLPNGPVIGNVVVTFTVYVTGV